MTFSSLNFKIGMTFSTLVVCLLCQYTRRVVVIIWSTHIYPLGNILSLSSRDNNEIILNIAIAHLQSHWEMNNVKINIVQLCILQCLFQARSDQFWSMESAPKLPTLKNETLTSEFIHFGWVTLSNVETFFYTLKHTSCFSSFSLVFPM